MRKKEAGEVSRRVWTTALCKPKESGFYRDEPLKHFEQGMA